mmetsp:Transcript_26909/g.48542  ORF Transcript_26909/g.48542 Transcript_26909/m.48542 type:complete len:167 (+) Transcript_26909:181-681(+)|eukprot:CAMPEP_0201897588 /NCGR_PEP_ID=MMETSP0902-20130614/46857_1 /ASSEMBLY_ACC=CAM_ASM_000551 /TAXON_ID=420261 /ORGANISM="Thalassiosira antarctica, Strain CCMP982" /LENGTH=166 /DNA_ID=CAMNT_0048430491 /DNA_START=159 /DNA_END=659 /DNA_ORIENTATION=+
MDGDDVHGTVKLVSKEGDTFEVPVEIAKLSNLVVTTLGEDDDEEDMVEIPLPNVKATVLAKVIEYCTHYKQVESMTSITTPLKSNRIEEIVQEWYADFVNVDQTLLFELVTAANFMDIKALLDLTCLAVSVLIKGKSAEEIRRIFNISNDFSPEEEDDQVVREEKS